MKYIFYWDESFHTRKITKKEKSINIYGENESDIYVSVYIGGTRNEVNLLLEDYRVIENEIKRKREYDDKQEFKGTDIKKHNFTYGVKTFNKEALSFYSKFFKMLYDDKTLYHITMISKTEMLIKQSFEKINSPFIKTETFYYSLIKFLYNYKYIPVMLEFFEENEVSQENLIIKIKSLLKIVINKTEGIPRKQKETSTLKELLDVLENVPIEIETKLKYLWNYNLSYEGFNFYLKEMNIDKRQCCIYMDKESHVHKYGLKYNYGKLQEVDSKKNIGIRISDILSNFIGRISYAFQQDTKEKEIVNLDNIKTEDFENKVLPSKEWFDISKSQFQLYKVAAKYFELCGNIHWSSYTGIYFDSILEFFSLFQYINLYESYEEFHNVNPLMHTEKYNSYVCERLQEKFNIM